MNASLRFTPVVEEDFEALVALRIEAMRLVAEEALDNRYVRSPA